MAKAKGKSVAKNTKKAPAKKKPRGKAFPKLVPTNVKSPQRKKDQEEFIQRKKAEEAAGIPQPVNEYSLKGRLGAPRNYNTPEEWVERSEYYFEYIKGLKGTKKVKVAAGNLKGYVEVEEEYWIREPEPVTITGYACFMGFAGRQGLHKYKHEHTDFVDVVNYYISLIAHGYEKNLHLGKAIGSMFALKNIDNWQDRTEIYNDYSDKVVQGFNYVMPKPPDDEDNPNK